MYSSWKLDQTEGPIRIRNRFKRCHLVIKSKFLLPDAQAKREQKHHKKPLSYLIETLIQRPNFSLINQVLHTFSCKYIAIDKEIDGEMIITESHLIFLENNNDINEIKVEVLCNKQQQLQQLQPLALELSNITDIWHRRYQHQEIAYEIFLESQISKLFVLPNSDDRISLNKFFADKIVQK